MSLKWFALLYGRNEGLNVPTTILSLWDQTIKPNQIIYVDDGSTDDSVYFVCELIMNRPDIPIFPIFHKWTHPNLNGRKELSRIANETIKYMYRHYPSPDFFLQGGADMIYYPSYMETLLDHFKKDPLLVCASGWIFNDVFPFEPRFPRGTGRVYRFDFWTEHVKVHPTAYCWESYPMFKAMSLGYHVRAFKCAPYMAIRSTRNYPHTHGRADKELGYSKIYTLGKGALKILQSPRYGVRQVASYLASGHEVDPPMSRRLRAIQRRMIAGRVARMLRQGLRR